MPKVIKPSNPFTNVCWVSVLTAFSAPPQRKFWLHRQFSLPLNSRNEEMMGDGFLWCYCCRFVLDDDVCWAHPVISRASAVASSIFFMVLFPMLFEIRRIVCMKIKQTLNNELKFHGYLIFINVYQSAMNRHCIPGLTMSTALTGNFSAGVSGNN